MTRTLTFEGPRAGRRFELLWTALASGGDGKGDRSPATIRKEARLQEALDVVSDPVEGNGTTPDTRTVKAAGGSVTLTQEDFELLHQYTEKTSWNPRVSRDVVDLWDWLSSCDKKE